MNFEIIPSEIFLEQVKKLNDQNKKQIKNKIELIKLNPFRFKSINSKKFSRVFRIRLNVEGRDVRLVYTIIGSKIILACLLDRGKDYKDLEDYLARIKTV
jgi:mRNA-degrading endonuclease RelE of RelBE toxin-antitoxin system